MKIQTISAIIMSNPISNFINFIYEGSRKDKSKLNYKYNSKANFSLGKRLQRKARSAQAKRVAGLAAPLFSGVNSKRGAIAATPACR
jgi:hypothetical protein